MATREKQSAVPGTRRSDGPRQAGDPPAGVVDEVMPGTLLASRSPQRAPRLDLRSVVALQRLAGNRAMGRRLAAAGAIKSPGGVPTTRSGPAEAIASVPAQHETRAGGPATPGRSLVAQREDLDTDEDEVEADETDGPDPVGELLDEVGTDGAGTLGPRGPREIPSESIEAFLAGEHAEGPAEKMSPQEKAALMAEQLGSGGDMASILTARIATRNARLADRSRPLRRATGTRGQRAVRRQERLTRTADRRGRHQQHLGSARRRGDHHRSDRLNSRLIGTHLARGRRAYHSQVRDQLGMQRQKLDRPVSVARTTTAGLDRDRVRGRRRAGSQTAARRRV